MSQGDKSQLWNELKAAGVTFEHHYREYSTEELQAAVDVLHADPNYSEPTPDPEPPRIVVPPQPERPRAQQKSPQLTEEFAGQHAYRPNAEESPLRVDEQGLTWFRDEVRKPAAPAPRMRRKLTYVDSGTRRETVVDGKYVETFEVAGNERRVSEVRITMPSYQVGVYLDPRFPFKIHVYNERRGFDLFDVQKFYGGADLVPTEVKKVYIENDLCYDMRTTIRAIEDEYRRQTLKENQK